MFLKSKVFFVEDLRLEVQGLHGASRGHADDVAQRGAAPGDAGGHDPRRGLLGVRRARPAQGLDSTEFN